MAPLISPVHEVLSTNNTKWEIVVHTVKGSVPFRKKNRRKEVTQSPLI